MTKVKIENWDGTTYTLDELEDLIDQADEISEHTGDSIEAAFDGDLSTPPAIMRSLIEAIRELGGE